MQFPAWILLGGSVLAGFYASINKIQGITIQVPLILLGVFVLYVAGRIIVSKSKDNQVDWNENEQQGEENDY